MAGYETIEVDVDGALATLVLDRPEALNAYNLRMRDELHRALTDLAALTELKVLVVSGRGRAFCAGGDLTEFGTAPSPFVARRIRFQRDVWAALRGFPVPTVARVHGYLIGTGLELALHCTTRLAGESTRLVMPETALGLLPAAGGTQTLPRQGSAAAVADLLYAGRRLDAHDALAAGLVDRVVPDHELDAQVDDVVGHLVSLPRRRCEVLVRLLRLQDDLPLRDAIRYERLLGSSSA